jgi:hypothetical protein
MSKSDGMRRPVSGKDDEEFFPTEANAAVLIFFIAGLLYLLRFERVDNLGAYSIPSETGLLIPSVIASYPQTRVFFMGIKWLIESLGRAVAVAEKFRTRRGAQR